MKNLVFGVRRMIAAISLALACVCGIKASDTPPMHIYLCVGQSNMEGYGDLEAIDLTDVPARFRMMAAVDFNSPSRKKHNWYEAMPPLVRSDTHLSVVDWFGRTMVDNLSEDISVGVVCVAIGGSKIEYLDKDFDEEMLSEMPDWMRKIAKVYDDHPYTALVQAAKKAQESGEIKGIILHQGESNYTDMQWPLKVKKLYNDLLADLGLEAADVPLLVGEAVTTPAGGRYGVLNGMVSELPSVIPTAYIVSAGGLSHKGDWAHFTSASYRVLGCRYAEIMLGIMGIENPVVAFSADEPEAPVIDPAEGDFEFPLSQFNPSIYGRSTWDEETGSFLVGAYYGFGGWEYGPPFDLSGFKYIVAELAEPQAVDTGFHVQDTKNYWSPSFRRAFGRDNTVVVERLDALTKPVDESDPSKGTEPLDVSRIYRVGFTNWGGTPIRIKRVYATNKDPYGGVGDVVIDSDAPMRVYNLQGMPVDVEASGIDALPRGIYIVNGKKVVVGGK